MMTPLGWMGLVLLLEFLLLAFLMMALMRVLAWETTLNANRERWLKQLREWRMQLRGLRRQTDNWQQSLPADWLFLAPPWLRKALAVMRIAQRMPRRPRTNISH